MTRIVIDLPNETLRKARAEAQRKKTTVSTYIAELLEQRVADDEFQQMLDEMLARTGGPLTTKESAWADSVLGIKPERRHR